MREKTIENYLCDEVKKLGGIPYKFTSPGRRGVTDRICVFPENIIVFVECKSPTGRLTCLQDLEIKELKKRRAKAVVIDSRPRVDALISWVRNVMKAKKVVREAL